MLNTLNLCRCSNGKQKHKSTSGYDTAREAETQINFHYDAAWWPRTWIHFRYNMALPTQLIQPFGSFTRAFTQWVKLEANVNHEILPLISTSRYNTFFASFYLSATSSHLSDYCHSVEIPSKRSYPLVCHLVLFPEVPVYYSHFAVKSCLLSRHLLHHMFFQGHSHFQSVHVLHFVRAVSRILRLLK